MPSGSGNSARGPPARDHHRGRRRRGLHQLARGDLSRWFTFGAYAGVGLQRSDIVRTAVERAEATVGHNVPNTEIYVIGAPLDIEAAWAVGCTAIAVATGHYDRAALRDAGADHVLATLEEELPIG